MKYLFLPIVFALLMTSCTRVIVAPKKDNGKHKGWFKNRHNPHHPNSDNPGQKKKGNSGNKKKLCAIHVW